MKTYDFDCIVNHAKELQARVEALEAEIQKFKTPFGTIQKTQTLPFRSWIQSSLIEDDYWKILEWQYKESLPIAEKNDQINAENVMESKEVLDVWAFEDKHNIPRETRFSTLNLAREDKSLTVLSHLSSSEIEEYQKLYQKGMESSTRFENRKCDGQDSKFLYHIVRLFDQAEQILLEGDMDIQRAKDVLKSIRRGEWTLQQIKDWTAEKDKELEAAYIVSKLPDRPPVEPLYQILVNCLESHYGNLRNCISQLGWAENTLKSVDDLLNSVRDKLYSGDPL